MPRAVIKLKQRQYLSRSKTFTPNWVPSNTKVSCPPQGMRQRAEDGANALAMHDSNHALRLGSAADGHRAAGRGRQARGRQLGRHAARAPLPAALAGVHLGVFHYLTDKYVYH